MNTKDLYTFFTSSSFVWCSENFQSFILSELNQNSELEVGKGFAWSNIADSANLDKDHLVFNDVPKFLITLQTYIQAQQNGEDGVLLHDSSANTFFVRTQDGKLYSVLVRFEQAQKLWRCGAYLQTELSMPNIRIFYP